jgi:hypothetical protein
MSTLQHDELLTQSEILEKETLPPAKEADQHAEGAKGASRKAFRDAKDPLGMTGYCCLRRRNGKSKRDSSLCRLRLE